ncbi:PucR family transcriptional regulator [Aquibacillus albus]|uniref:PucR C-terminal helix-turn-helix domain-containing protein n=1 Tax=Aquibacillus albus TaxID=1168171 RepID=A0ABS2MZX3_9BACI|nr:helix-turn-helix domain-containing protein [Aquibacillus albus]MBM7571436.1 hypothetical protein [Aquibacillus albus]
MIEKLKEIFPSMVEANPEEMMDTEFYEWYKTTENKIVGIHKEEMTKKEELLLETFLTPYYVNHPPVTKREEDWIDVLFHQGNPKKLLSNKDDIKFRFVYFSLSDDNVDQDAFREAIHGLFPYQVPIIWENNHEGMIIEEDFRNEEDMISYSEIIDVLMSDFYMKVRLFVGPYSNEIKHSQAFYGWIKQCFYDVYPYNKQVVINYVSAVPYLFLKPLSSQSTSFIIDSILRDTVNEEDLLQTIRIFLECNSNATFAAKKLYMHRNSLQYRVDKFIEKTGIDVKQFEGALSVYLTLLLKQNSEKK